MRSQLPEHEACTQLQVGQKLAEIPDELKRPCRFNDGKASPIGTFIVGTMHDKWVEGEPAQMFRLAGKPMGQHSLEQVLHPNPIPLGTSCSHLAHVHNVSQHASLEASKGEDRPLGSPATPHDWC